MLSLEHPLAPPVTGERLTPFGRGAQSKKKLRTGTAVGAFCFKPGCLESESRSYPCACMLTVNRNAGIFDFSPSPHGSGAHVFALLYAMVIRNVVRGDVNSRYRI